MAPYESWLLATTATNQNPQMLKVDNFKTSQTKYWVCFKTRARGTRAFAYLGTHTDVFPCTHTEFHTQEKKNAYMYIYIYVYI